MKKDHNSEITPRVIPMDNIAAIPAPWNLNGHGYIFAYRFNSDFRKNNCFLPPTIEGKVGPISMAMIVRYDHSPVGPYDELLFIPGYAKFNDMKNHLTISQIFVSTTASVVNGQNNWGIPKQLANFSFNKISDNEEHVTVSIENKVFFEAKIKTSNIGIPFNTKYIPKPLKTMAQHWDNKTFFYCPSGRSNLRPCKLLETNIDSDHFPELSQGLFLGGVKCDQFTLEFPQGTVVPKT